MKRHTRREVAAIFGAGAMAAAAMKRAEAQAPTTRDWYRETLDGKRAAGKELAEFTLPPGTEPAFQFKA